MNMRDRLVKLLYNVECVGEESFLNCPERRNGNCRSIQRLEMCQVSAISDHLIQNGVIVQPCKVGDTIYFVCGYNIAEYTVKNIMYDNIFWQFDCENDMYAGEHRNFSFFDERIGKTVFLTREEAEKALERSKQ